MRFRLSEEEIKKSDSDELINPFDISAPAVALSLQEKKRPTSKGILQPLIKYEKDKDIPQTWLIYLLLPILSLLILSLSLFREKIIHLFKILFNSSFRSLAYRNSKGKAQPQEIPLFFLSWLSYAAVGFLLINANYIHQGNFFLAVCTTLGLSLAFLLFKWSSISCVKYLFPQRKDMDYVLFLFKQYNFALGIIMIPFSFLFAFSNVTNIILMILGLVLGLCLLFRIISGLQLMLKFLSGNTFRFFTYFCTVEIAPMVILWVSLKSILLF
ncbi:MAG: DUF4271 domain-containing protein [Saprospiraceae bacterium]